jgi:hypothetical protein
MHEGLHFEFVFMRCAFVIFIRILNSLLYSVYNMLLAQEMALKSIICSLYGLH